MTTLDDVMVAAIDFQRCITNDDISRFIAVVEQYAAEQVAAETARCEKIAEAEMMNLTMLTSYPPKSSAAWNILGTIRARTQEEQT